MHTEFVFKLWRLTDAAWFAYSHVIDVIDVLTRD